VRSQAETRQLNLPRGTEKTKSRKTEKLKQKNGYAQKNRYMEPGESVTKKEGGGESVGVVLASFPCMRYCRVLSN